MKQPSDYLNMLQKGELDDELRNLYLFPKKHIERYKRIVSFFTNEIPTYIISAPGRTELGGNHTDHNNGKVLASAVHLDSVCAVQKSADSIITLYSEGYNEPFIIDISDTNAVEKEQGSTNALLRGVSEWFIKHGYKVGGFTANVHSHVLSGSGLSSSASIEVLIAAIFNFLFNSGNISPVELALAGQYAENIHFGKPCGLMDQLACSVGGIIEIDFKDPENPKISPVVTEGFGDYKLLVIDTGGSHADLTNDYASVPKEMKETAALYSCTTCRELNEEIIISDAERIRHTLGDRHLLRVIHFFEENKRVDSMAALLKNNEIDNYLKVVQESGDSSFMFLQNCYPPKSETEQGIPVALQLTKRFFNGRKCAYRVHGGGFAGTIQAYVPKLLADEYTSYMNSIFGEDTVTELYIRNTGAYCFGFKNG